MSIAKTITLVVCLVGFSSTALYSQDYPCLQNDFKSEISDFILSQKNFKTYDFIILKYAECYWFEKTEYRLICFSKSSTDLITITRKKKNDKIKIGSKHKADFKQLNYLIDSLTQMGLFTLKESDLLTELIKSLSDFPVKEINTEIKKLTDVGDDFIEELLLTQKDSRYSFPILAMLYPDMDYKNNNFHQDHLHPASTYDHLKQEHKEKFGWTAYNSILNLQMLDSNENMSKNATPLDTWITEQTKNKDKDRFIESHLIPKVDYSLENFDNFIVERKKILIEKLKNILN